MGIITVNTDFEKLYGITEREYYSKQYLTFEAILDGSINLTIPHGILENDPIYYLGYSIDEGETWKKIYDINVDNYDEDGISVSIDVNSGDKVLFKGVSIYYAYYDEDEDEEYYTNINLTGNFKIYGNIMSLLYNDNYTDKTFFDDFIYDNEYYHVFANLFLENEAVMDCGKLILPTISLSKSCYENMFNGCTGLTEAPELPATSLASNCYDAMFSGCTSLTEAPELPAINLSSYCYASMFYGCTSLTEAPELPATTLASNCYDGMFYGCTGLTEAPELPATRLNTYCYQYMFSGCTSLTEAPELPATTLANACYYVMFKDCTSLTEAPELPATRLAEHCYLSMFYNCTNLNYIKALFTTTPSNTYTLNWVQGIAASGTFVKNSSATWNVTGVHGIPTGWTVETSN